MRYILGMLLCMSTLWSVELHWSHDYEQSLKKAQKEKKLIYVLITSDSCRWCRKFESTTLQDKTILKRLYSEFVPVHLSRDRHKIPKAFATAPVPRHYFTDAKGEILYSSLGHRGVACFDAFMDNAEDKLKISQ